MKDGDSRVRVLGTMRVETGTRTVVENGPQGTRTIVQINGGRFEGPRLKRIDPGTVRRLDHERPDGSYRLDVRVTLRTDDGALMLVTYSSIGQTTNAGASLRATPLFETGDSRYSWLTRLQAVAVGERASERRQIRRVCPGSAHASVRESLITVGRAFTAAWARRKAAAVIMRPVYCPLIR